jgi:hypothetical protein
MKALLFVFITAVIASFIESERRAYNSRITAGLTREQLRYAFLLNAKNIRKPKATGKNK